MEFDVTQMRITKRPNEKTKTKIVFLPHTQMVDPTKSADRLLSTPSQNRNERGGSWELGPVWEGLEEPVGAYVESATSGSVSGICVGGGSDGLGETERERSSPTEELTE